MMIYLFKYFIFQELTDQQNVQNKQKHNGTFEESCII